MSPGNRKWTQRNLTENRATTFSSDPDRERKPLIGKTGKTRNSLTPAGTVEIDGNCFHAVAESGFIDEDRTVRVVSLRDFRLVVTESS